ncbi:porin [Sphingomonas sediminicola]|uniref:OprO/OprP family phosphate-selective porin n=1 Tax=Sphingomonas sediminicola TaxID=386874 RepID=UPI003CEA8D77
MTRKFVIAALLAGTAVFAAPAQAAAQEAPAAQEPTAPDASDATADATIANTNQVDDLQAKIELLQAQVEALQESLEGVKKQQAKAVPSWKGGPEFADKDTGFTFKPKGFAQFDTGYVGFPDGDERRGTVSGLNFQNLGFNSRARRLVFGAEGTLPGRFGYKVEFNFAQGTVDYEDIILTYDFEKAPLQVSVGNFYPYSSLETMTSSRLGSMLERASFTDAFNYNRRLGIGLQFSDKATDSYLVQAGIFSTPINDASFTRTGWQASLRALYTPTLGSTRLHVGANFQHRSNSQESLGAQYRTRPLTQITDQRFIDTGTLASSGDDTLGVEFAAIHKSLHVAAEAQKVWVRNTFTAAELAATNADPNDNDVATGTALNGNPSFWGGYFELGYFLTGETRAYKGGKWDRTKVLKPWNDGGWGALQINGRVDYVDLSDRVDSSATYAAPFYVNGGKQLGLQASLIWNPIDWVRFMAQYGHVEVTGGPRALGLVDPNKPANKRKFGADTFAARAQIEF